MKSDNTVMRSLHRVLSKLPLMLTCEEFEEFVLDYYEGTLPARQNAVFRLHLLVCKDCQRYLAVYKRSIEMGKAAFDDPYTTVPETVPEDLVQAIVAAKKTE